MKIKLVAKLAALVVLITFVLAVSPVRAQFDDNQIYNFSFLSMTGTLNQYLARLESVNWDRAPASFSIPSVLYYNAGHDTYLISEIAADAFAGCTATSIYLGRFLNDVTGAYTFENCTSLRSVEFENGSKFVLENMFKGCANLDSITFPVDCSLVIRSSAFEGCTRLTEVVFPSGIESIEGPAFSGCTRLTKAIFQGAKPYIETDAFSGTAAGFKIYYPIGQSGWPGSSGYPTQAYCNVTYDRNYSGGSQILLMSNVDSNHRIAAPTNPTRTGWVFGGWYKEATCTNPWNFDSDTVTADITLYAKWTFADNTAPTLISVNISSSNGSITKAKTGDTITLNFTASEIIQTPTVTIAGNSAAVNNAGDSNDATWRATYVMKGTDTEGPVAFSISFSDQVGNAGTAVNVTTDSSCVTYDRTMPTLNSLSPADNAVNVGVNSNLVITFNENVIIGTGNITIKKTADDSIVEPINVTDAAKVTGSGATTITINPATTLAGKTGYYIVIATTAFKDTAGNNYAGISGTTVWNFTTADPSIPTINFIRPGAGTKLNITTGSTVIAEVICAGDTIAKDSITIQIDDGVPVKPAGFADITGGYKLYYVITGINYSTANNSYKITITAANSSGTQTSESITFTMDPKRKGFGFGRLRFD